MKIRTHSLTTLLCATMASVVCTAPPARAGYIVTFTQVGPNVVATGSGAIDYTGLGKLPFNTGAFIAPNSGLVITGPTASQNVDGYFFGGSFMPFGGGGLTSASSGSGDLVGIGTPGLVFGIVVPLGYVSGTPLSDTATYDNATFVSLGVTPGTYKLTWGTGANQNFTLKIGGAAVPDTGSTFGLLFLSLATLFGVGHFRFRRSA